MRLSLYETTKSVKKRTYRVICKSDDNHYKSVSYDEYYEAADKAQQHFKKYPGHNLSLIHISEPTRPY